MKNASVVIDEVFSEFTSKFGRKYSKINEEMMDDADIVFITLGSCTGTAREFIKMKRKEGKKIGLLKITVFRPFPKEEIRKALKGKKVVAVIDRNISFGFGGAVYGEVAAAMNGMDESPKIVDFIVGLGGRDITFNTFEEVLSIAEKAMNEEVDEINWIDVDKEAVEKEEII